MNKPLILSLAAATLLTTNLSAESMYERIQTMELQMQELQKELTTLKSQKSSTPTEDESSEEEAEEEESDSDEEDEEDEREPLQDQIDEIQESITDLNIATNGSHLKFGVDYRFALDNMQYKMADGSKQENDAFMTNRLWVNMEWLATDNLSFKGQLAYNKAFGARSGASMPQNSSFENFDWITNENAYDDVLRVRSAYFLYMNDTFIGTEIPWTFSIGRRPSTNGHLISLRDDDMPSSPLGHTINVEFDGLSAKFGFENLTGIDGMYAKICAGRGLTNAAPKFNSAPYANTDTNSNPDIDLIGLIFAPWSNGQYGITTQYYYANNLIDAKNPMDQTQGFDTVGGLHSFTANFTADGIGDEISDYLDYTKFFISGAATQTAPKDGQSMLGSTEAETGYSIWVGLQMPSVMSEDGKWGLEYNKGSKYWRSITYAEDTNIGSKIAARGDAYEIYFTEPLVDEILTLQVRYTYIDYKYTGSNGFFGKASGAAYSIDSLTSGNPMSPYDASNVVSSAQDIRFYLRYRY